MLSEYFQDQMIEKNIYTQKMIDDVVDTIEEFGLEVPEANIRYLNSKLGKHFFKFVAIERNPIKPELLVNRYWVQPFSDELELFEDTVEYLQEEDGRPLFRIIDREGFHFARDTIRNNVMHGVQK